MNINNRTLENGIKFLHTYKQINDNDYEFGVLQNGLLSNEYSKTENDSETSNGTLSNIWADSDVYFVQNSETDRGLENETIDGINYDISGKLRLVQLDEYFYYNFLDKKQDNIGGLGDNDEFETLGIGYANDFYDENDELRYRLTYIYKLKFNNKYTNKRETNQFTTFELPYEAEISNIKNGEIFITTYTRLLPVGTSETEVLEILGGEILKPNSSILPSKPKARLYNLKYSYNSSSINYILYRGIYTDDIKIRLTDIGGNIITEDVLVSNIGTYTNSSLLSNTNYKYSIITNDNEILDTISFKTEIEVILNPVGVINSISGISYNSANINCSVNQDAVDMGYKLVLRNTGTSDFITMDLINGTNIYEFNDLDENTEYNVFIGLQINGIWSEILDSKIFTTTEKPLDDFLTVTVNGNDAIFEATNTTSFVTTLKWVLGTFSIDDYDTITTNMPGYGQANGELINVNDQFIHNNEYTVFMVINYSDGARVVDVQNFTTGSLSTIEADGSVFASFSDTDYGLVNLNYYFNDIAKNNGYYLSVFQGDYEYKIDLNTGDNLNLSFVMAAEPQMGYYFKLINEIGDVIYSLRYKNIIYDITNEIGILGYETINNNNITIPAYIDELAFNNGYYLSIYNGTTLIDTKNWSFSGDEIFDIIDLEYNTNYTIKIENGSNILDSVDVTTGSLSMRDISFNNKNMLLNIDIPDIYDNELHIQLENETNNETIEFKIQKNNVFVEDISKLNSNNGDIINLVIIDKIINKIHYNKKVLYLENDNKINTMKRRNILL